MGLFNFEQVDSDLTVWFILEGNEYEVGQFNIGFGQEVDYKGEPQNEVRGGMMTIVLSQAVSASVHEWAMKTTPKNGEVVFRSKTASSPLRIEFLNAYCIGFKQTIIDGSGLKTILQVSPEELSVNGISFDNHWVK